MTEHKTINTGRNLPAAIGSGLALGVLVLVTLLTVKVTFLIMVAVLVVLALIELSRALLTIGIKIMLIPIAVGGMAEMALAYWRGATFAVAALALTLIVIQAWRLPHGSAGYIRDVSSSVFALLYLPTMAIFVALMLAPHNGNYRALLYVILTACSDVGGYFAGILFGRHPMAPRISPKKTWEGLAGSVVACLAGGAIGMVYLLHGQAWQGLLLGAAIVGAAVLGDLVESEMKRDLNTKDMGTMLPGHGGVLDRIDSLLVAAPVAWLLMRLFLGP